MTYSMIFPLFKIDLNLEAMKSSHCFTYGLEEIFFE